MLSAESAESQPCLSKFPDLSYDFTRTVVYESDTEYRTELMHTFRLPIPAPVFGPAPPETNEPLPYTVQQELDVDFDRIAQIVEQIVEITKHDRFMRSLYEKAAARLLSTDINTGGVLLITSFTAFSLFHTCLQTFFAQPSEWSDKHPAYVELMRRMAKPPRS